MTRIPFSPVVERALRCSARAHLHQVRKATDVPYITHPCHVALILLQHGFTDEHLLSAAILHDVLEDTDVSEDALAAEFPPEVVETVLALSERKRDAAGQPRAWIDRKQEHLAHIREAPLAARAVALADKLHNLGTMVFDLQQGAPLWERFNASRDDVLWYHREMVAAARGQDDLLDPLASACRELVQQLADSPEHQIDPAS